MLTASRTPRLLLPSLAALFLALTWGAPSAQAAGSSTASSALQIGVQVVRSCAVDTTSVRAAGTLDATREALVSATQSSLSVSCAATQTRVTVAPVLLGVIEPLGTAERLDVEF